MTQSQAAMLDAYLRQFAGEPFDWGLANCCHFAAGWVLKMEPHNTADFSFPDSLAGAMRCIKAAGSLQDAITERLDRAPICILMARLGDLVLMRGDVAGAVGICNGRTVACRGTVGVEFRNLLHGDCAWPLGDVQ